MRDKLEKKAKEYIDAAIETQRKLGYGVDVPQESYDRAVLRASRALRQLQATPRRG